MPKLTQKELENLNRPMMSKEIEAVIKNLQTKISPGPDGVTGRFNQTFKELTILKLFQKIKEDRTLPKLLYEVSVNLVSKSVKDITRKDNDRSITLMNIYTKTLNTISAH